MLQNPKVFQSSIKSHPPIPPTPPSQIQNIPTSPSSPIIKQCCKLSRRELAIFVSSSLLLLPSSQALKPFDVSRARAEEKLLDQDANVTDQQEENNASNNAEADLPVANKNEEINASSGAEEGLTDANKNDEQQKKANVGPNCSNKAPTKRAFLDISIDGEPAGCIIIGLYGKDTPAGATRFGNLVSGAAGISYRRKEFVKIMPNYVQHGGVRSYGVHAELARRKGTNLAAESLVDEWEREYVNCPGVKNLAGTVSIIVRDPSKPPPKLKLVAKQGKLEIDQEEVGIDPNGTEFVISTKDSPELDASSLVVGRVLEGMEVVEKIGQVKTVQENTRSPYFRVAKLIGDKRAVVAERGFNRPYSKVVVTNCGLME